jgi:group I intron endonuclease
MTIGIYELLFVDNSFYIGQSSNIEKRFKNHIYALRNKSHTNFKLSDTFNRLGLPKLNILEECTIEELDDKELFWIIESDAVVKGLNIASGPLNSLRGEKHSKSIYDNTAIEELFFQIVYTDIPLFRLNKELSAKNLAQVIACGENHSWLKDKYPAEYQIMLNKLGTRKYDAKAQGIKYPKIVSPDGKIYEVTNLNEFARRHKLLNSCLHRLLTYKAKSHKGWRLAA